MTVGLGEVAPTRLIEQLRAWFHPKDRSVFLTDDAYFFLPWAVGVNNYLALAFISETELEASAASVAFDFSDYQQYRMLMYEFEPRTDRAAEVDGVLMRANTDAGANYDYIRLTGNAAAAAATTSRVQNEFNAGQCEGANSRADCFAPLMGYINSYARSDREKFFNQSISGAFGDRSADADINVQLRRGAWQNKNPITNVTVLPEVGANFVDGSLFRWWGIL